MLHRGQRESACPVGEARTETEQRPIPELRDTIKRTVGDLRLDLRPLSSVTLVVTSPNGCCGYDLGLGLWSAIVGLFHKVRMSTTPYENVCCSN